VGHIYTPEEFALREIPTAKDYDNAIAMFEKGVRYLVEKEILYGAAFTGSITYCDFERGSDIDVFVVVESHSGEEHLRDVVLQITDTTKVHFDMKAITRNAALSGQHRLLYFYVDTIRRFPGRWIVGNDPLQILTDRSKWPDIQEELMEDLAARVDSLVKARLHTVPDFQGSHCALLDRIVTLPVYAAIGIVRLKYGTQPTNTEGSRLSKAETCRLFGQIVQGEPASMVMEILRRKRNYREALNTPDLAVANYRDLLRDIDEAYPLACAVIEQSASFLYKHRLGPKNSA